MAEMERDTISVLSTKVVQTLKIAVTLGIIRLQFRRATTTLEGGERRGGRLKIHHLRGNILPKANCCYSICLYYNKSYSWLKYCDENIFAT